MSSLLEAAIALMQSRNQPSNIGPTTFRRPIRQGCGVEGECGKTNANCFVPICAACALPVSWLLHVAHALFRTWRAWTAFGCETRHRGRGGSQPLPSSVHHLRRGFCFPPGSECFGPVVHAHRGARDVVLSGDPLPAW